MKSKAAQSVKKDGIGFAARIFKNNSSKIATYTIGHAKFVEFSLKRGFEYSQFFY